MWLSPIHLCAEADLAVAARETVAGSLLGPFMNSKSSGYKLGPATAGDYRICMSSNHRRSSERQKRPRINLQRL